MEIYFWFFTIVAVLYGGLTVFASYSQFRKEKISVTSGILMIIGGFLIILSAFKESPLANYALVILILGLVFIHISAINNGLKMHGKIHIKHHIIRLIVSILLVVTFLLK